MRPICSSVWLAIEALCPRVAINVVSILAAEVDLVSRIVPALVWFAASVAGTLWTRAVVRLSNNHLESGECDHRECQEQSGHCQWVCLFCRGFLQKMLCWLKWSLEVIIASSAGLCFNRFLSGFFILNGDEDGCNNNKRLHLFSNPICFVCLLIMYSNKPVNSGF